MMNKPKAGTRGDVYAFKGNGLTQTPVDRFTIKRVEGDICYSVYDKNPEIVSSFIWRFKDGLNRLHYWSGRDMNGIPYVVADTDETDLAF